MEQHQLSLIAQCVFLSAAASLFLACIAAVWFIHESNRQMKKQAKKFLNR